MDNNDQNNTNEEKLCEVCGKPLSIYGFCPYCKLEEINKQAEEEENQPKEIKRETHKIASFLYIVSIINLLVCIEFGYLFCCAAGLAGEANSLVFGFAYFIFSLLAFLAFRKYDTMDEEELKKAMLKLLLAIFIAFIIYVGNT